MPPALVIFDCDGTLVDSEIIANRVLVEVMAEHGLALSLAETVRDFKGRKMASSVEELERRLGRSLPDDFVPDLRRRTADAFIGRLQAVPGAIELVSAMRLPKCVASAGPREKMELTLTVTGLLPHFGGKIFSSYEVGSWKPDPGIFLHVAEVMGYSPADCVVVEDSLPGILGGLAAGMKVYAYQPDGIEESLPGEVVVIDHLNQLRPLFLE